MNRSQEMIKQLMDKKYKEIVYKKEEIATAFIAETGFKPSEIEMVQVNGFNDSGEPEERWFLRKRVEGGLHPVHAQVNQAPVSQGDALAGIIKDLKSLRVFDMVRTKEYGVDVYKQVNDLTGDFVDRWDVVSIINKYEAKAG